MMRPFATLTERFQWQAPPPALAPPASLASDPADAYLAVAADLLASGNPAGAEIVLSEGLRRHPGMATLLVLRARAAEARDAGPEAAAFWQAARAADSADADAHLAAGLQLRHLGRLDEADAALGAAVTLAPGRIGLASEYAWCAEFRAEHAEAVRRWEKVRALGPTEPTAWRRIAAILIERLGRPADADPVLSDAVARFPEDRELALEHARLAGAIGNWSEALLRWTALVRRYPHEAQIAAARGDAELKVQLQAADGVPASGDLAVARSGWLLTIGATVPGPEHRDLLLRFESLGVSCEFGLVQRYFGAEPLGLFRWSSIHPENLAIALEQRLDGIEREEELELKDLAGEYTVTQNRYRIAMHSFIRAAETKLSPEQLRRQFGRRMRFLRDKLLADIAEAGKIFVYQYPRLLEPVHMARLMAAFRACGPATIMFVHDVATDRPVGHVEQVEPGCLMGHVDRLVQDGDWTKVSTDAWLAVCRNAVALVDGRAAGGQAP